MINKYLIDGIDHLGKSTLAKEIINTCGFSFYIHSSKPLKLACYNNELCQFQYHANIALMKMLNSDVPAIFDRTHLGETVYSPMYRNYSGEYVFRLEEEYNIGSNDTVKLILLTEDFSKSNHFVDDGESFDITKRQLEQDTFVKSFHKSAIKNKKIICVTDGCGNFKSKVDVLREALT